MRLIILLMLSINLFATERIVTLSPAIAEIVSGLGSISEIVAVSKYTLYPPLLQQRPKIGGYTSFSLEKVLQFKPTLVIGLPYQKPFLKKLQAFGIKTLEVKLESIEDIEISIIKIATALRQENAAQMLVQQIEDAKSTQKQSKKRPSVLVVFASSSQLSKGIYVAGHDLFFEEILDICGAKNAYTDNYALQPVLTLESIIAADPEYVLLLLGPLDKVDPKTLKARWMQLPIKAVKDHHVHIIQNDYILIPSQRISKSINTICQVIRW